MDKTEKLHALSSVLQTLCQKQRQAQMRGEEDTAKVLNETAQKLENYIDAELKHPAGKP